MPPAEPGPVQLMNTVWADATGVHDDVTTPAHLHDWLLATDGRDRGRPSAEELAEASRLRDSLRRLAAFCTDDPRPAAQSPVGNVSDAIAAVNGAVAHRPNAQLVLREGRLDSTHAGPDSPTRVALAELAHDAIDMLTGPGVEKLRACLAPGCVRYFVRTHPRREWCSPACGNRARAARHYQRTRQRNTHRM